MPPATTSGPPPLDLNLTQREAISALATEDRIVRAPLALARAAAIPNDNLERAEADHDLAGFWRERARLVEWSRPFDEVYQFDLPEHRWFLGGQLNAAVNCIDRHVHGGRRNKAALLWIGEDGEEHDLGDPARYAEYWEQVPGGYSAGDIAVRDADGYFAVLGRTDDVLNVAGHRIGTADIEGSLLRHGAVAESAVIGLPDAVKGERIKAYVVLKPGKSATPALLSSLKDHVRQELGPIATPSELEIRETLPKTRSGKIVRRMLRAESLGQDPGDISTLAD